MCCSQATWALQNKTCDEVSAQLNNPFVNNTLAQKVILDFQAELTRQGWPEAAKTVVAVRQPCVTFDVSCRACRTTQILLLHDVSTHMLCHNKVTVAVASSLLPEKVSHVQVQ